MLTLILLLLLTGLILFILAGFSTPTRFNPIGFGLACWIATEFIGHVT